MKKIAIDIRHLCAPNPSGIGQYTIKLITKMAELNPNIRFLLFASGSKKALSYLPNFIAPNIFITRKRTPNRLISAMLKLPNGPSLEDFLPEQPDIWFFPNINIIKTQLPYILTIHDLSFKIYPEFFTKKDKLWYRAAKIQQLIKKAKTILAVSNNTANDLVSKFNISQTKIKITYLGVDPVFNSHIKPYDQNFLLSHKIRFPYFLSLSAIEPRKNIESIIEAYEYWKEKNLNRKEHLVITGGYGWKAKHIFYLIQKSKYKHLIHLIGYVPEKHKPSLYRHANIFLFPSFYEGFGLPVAEALACGTKVITSFTSSLPEIANNNVIFVDPYNVSDITNALDLIYTIPSQKTEISRRFSWEKTAALTIEQLI